jgi:hypothetical protein
MIEEYAYQIAGKKSEIIDKALLAILAGKAPFTLRIAKLLPFRRVWRLLGITMLVKQNDFMYAEYEVIVRGESLGTFSLRTEVTLS